MSFTLGMWVSVSLLTLIVIGSVVVYIFVHTDKIGTRNPSTNAIILHRDEHQKPWKTGRIIWLTTEGEKQNDLAVELRAPEESIEIFYITQGGIFSENTTISSSAKCIQVPGGALLASNCRQRQPVIESVNGKLLKLTPNLIYADDIFFGEKGKDFVFTGKLLSILLRNDSDSNDLRQNAQELCITFNESWDVIADITALITKDDAQPSIVVMSRKDMHDIFNLGDFSRLNGLLKKRLLQFTGNLFMEVLVQHVVQRTCSSLQFAIADKWLQYMSSNGKLNGSKKLIMDALEKMPDLSVLYKAIEKMPETFRLGLYSKLPEERETLLRELGLNYSSISQ